MGTWLLTGNAGTDPTADFLGTTDDQPLVIKSGSGNVGIGTAAPAFALDVNGDIGVNGVDAIRRDANNAYIFPFGTKTANNNVVVGGGPGGDTSLQVVGNLSVGGNVGAAAQGIVLNVSGDIGVNGVDAIRRDPNNAYIFPFGTKTANNNVVVGGGPGGDTSLQVVGNLSVGGALEGQTIANLQNQIVNLQKQLNETIANFTVQINNLTAGLANADNAITNLNNEVAEIQQALN